MSEQQHNTALNEADFMRLLLLHENALRAFARSLLPCFPAGMPWMM
jgi:hypothetical protein